MFSMQTMSPGDFFDLSGFAHAVLFAEHAYVWEALDLLDHYLQDTVGSRIEGTVSKQAYLINPETISIGKGTVVEPGAYIQGPCIIGPQSIVRHGAYIRGGVITASHVVIGHASEIKNSILLQGARAGHFAYVGDSILGREVNLGAGVRLANLRFDNQPISIRWGEARVSTGRRKLGAILGDGAQLGCNCVTNPGTLFGKGALAYPCIHVGGVIPHGSILKPESISTSRYA